jgi:DNA-directed RNA polymerases I and III subunit RPAC1
MTFSTLKQLVPSKRAEFVIDGMDVSLVNALRRVVLSEIPNVAIPFNPYKESDNTVIVHKNTTPLHNEIIIHRMSLVPICIHPNDLNSTDVMGYRYVLRKKNTSNELLDVTTDDITVYDSKGLPVDTATTQQLFPHNPVTKSPILITKLRPNIFDKENGDEIHLEATATVGTAGQNACWSPVSLCTFENVVDTEQAAKALKEKLADKSLSKEERQKITNNFEVLERYRYFKKNEYDEPSQFVFKVESECRYTPEYIVFKGLLVLLNNVVNLNQRLNKVKSIPFKDDVIALHGIGDVANYYQLAVQGEMHTMGNLIQSYLYNNYIRATPDTFLTYIGYHCPHPLESVVVFRLKVVDSGTPEQLIKFCVEATDALITYLSGILDEWIDFAKLDDAEYNDVLLWQQTK